MEVIQSLELWKEWRRDAFTLCTSTTHDNKNEMNTTVEIYITGLKNAYFENNGQKEWEHFEKVIHGAKNEDTW